MKTAAPPKPDQSEKIPCFECDKGNYQKVVENYKSDHPKLGEFEVPDVTFLVCDNCGDRLLGTDGNAKIDKWLEQALNVIPPDEIRRFLQKYDLTQKEASEITGLGEKNLSRWMNGRSRPSETVSNYLRLLLSDESAFERLRQRNFSDVVEMPRYPAEERQPDEEEAKILRQVDYPKLATAGFVEATRSPKIKRSQLCKLTMTKNLLEFGNRMSELKEKMAAFEDTAQNSNPISGGLWVYLGRKAAERITTAPYHRDKLWKAVKQLRELTPHPLEQVAGEVQSILAKAGVALVFVPIMKESALRGCTGLLSVNKAMIIHGLKFRSVSQFWLILFHEIAHLLLHVETPEDVFADYEEQGDDPRENAADNWAFDFLVSIDRELPFRTRNPQPEPWKLEEFANSIRVHPAILIEVFNRRSVEARPGSSNPLDWGYMKKRGLFPNIEKEAFSALVATSRVSA